MKIQRWDFYKSLKNIDKKYLQKTEAFDGIIGRLNVRVVSCWETVLVRRFQKMAEKKLYWLLASYE